MAVAARAREIILRSAIRYCIYIDLLHSGTRAKLLTETGRGADDFMAAERELTAGKSRRTSYYGEIKSRYHNGRSRAVASGATLAIFIEWSAFINAETKLSRKN